MTNVFWPLEVCLPWNWIILKCLPDLRTIAFNSTNHDAAISDNSPEIVKSSWSNRFWPLPSPKCKSRAGTPACCKKAAKSESPPPNLLICNQITQQLLGTKYECQFFPPSTFHNPLPCFSMNPAKNKKLVVQFKIGMNTITQGDLTWKPWTWWRMNQLSFECCIEVKQSLYQRCRALARSYPFFKHSAIHWIRILHLSSTTSPLPQYMANPIDLQNVVILLHCPKVIVASICVLLCESKQSQNLGSDKNSEQ